MKHFQPFELVSPAVYAVSGDNSLSLFDPEALQALDDLREFFGCSITINNWKSGGQFQRRGYRTLQNEMAVNPKSTGHSAHQLGKAFDCDIQGYTAEQAREKILQNQDNPLLAKIQRMEASVPWIHFDTVAPPAGMRRIHLFKA